MIDFGKWHGLIPRDPAENMRFRLELLRKCKEDRAFRRGVRELCSRDICTYVDCFVFQFNPLKGGQEAGPFILWPFQVGAIQQLLGSIKCNCPKYEFTHGHDIVIEKSREMGASWLCLIVLEWLWHFYPNQSFLCVSRNEESVEDDGGDSLFSKIDYIHRHQPDWLKPTIRRRKRYFGNADLSSDINGQATTSKAGVGGRHTAIFIDEASRIDQLREIVASTADTSKCRIYTGTHYGVDTPFHQLTKREDIRKLVVHWSLHPDKQKGLYRYDSARNQVDIVDKTYVFPPDYKFVTTEEPDGGPFPGLRSPWYDAECERRNDKRAVAEHLDINPGGSQKQFFDPLVIRNLRYAYCRDEDWRGQVLYDTDSGRPKELVETHDGDLRLWVRPDYDGKLPAGKYAAGADISTGAGATNSVLSIFDARRGEKVAELATCVLSPERFAAYCVAVMWLFKDEDNVPGLLCWEAAGPGFYYGRKVHELNYPHIYYRNPRMITTGGKRSKEPGWMPQGSHKRVLLDAYRAALYGKKCINFSDLALSPEEIGGYYHTGVGDQVAHSGEVNTDDPTGARYNHGDRVIADALAWKMVEELGVLEVRSTVKLNQPEVGTVNWRVRHAFDPTLEDPWATSKFDGWQTTQRW